MTVAEYLVHCIAKAGCTDIFGIPGGVVLDFLYAAENSSEVNIHLSAHEQGAGFAAVGYAQINRTLGVAYATRGPGFTNLYTAIADAYFDSHPVLFITAHAKKFTKTSARFYEEQEFDTVSAVKKITKYAARIESVEKAIDAIDKALAAALTGAPGAVFLDFLSGIWNQDVELSKDRIDEHPFLRDISVSDIERTADSLKRNIQQAKRPVLLVGAGVWQSASEDSFRILIEKLQIPVVSSTIAQDTIANSPYYFGYIGSHGLRYANYILEEADLIISIGNRLLYDRRSATFGSIARKKLIRIEIENLVGSYEEDAEIIHADLKYLLPALTKIHDMGAGHGEWVAYCSEVKHVFFSYDLPDTVRAFSRMLKVLPTNLPIVADVGNNEFFLMRAYTYVNCNNRFLMAKAFAAMGCALPKAIGVYYASRQSVLAVMGDQGSLFNIQELHYISTWKLPIVVVILNNYSSGMIKSKQKAQNRKQFVHTTPESGYNAPHFKKIAEAFTIPYYTFADMSDERLAAVLRSVTQPIMIEIAENTECDLPILPKGNKCYEFVPDMSSETKKQIAEIKEKYYGL